MGLSCSVSKVSKANVSSIILSCKTIWGAKNITQSEHKEIKLFYDNLKIILRLNLQIEKIYLVNLFFRFYFNQLIQLILYTYNWIQDIFNVKIKINGLIETINLNTNTWDKNFAYHSFQYYKWWVALILASCVKNTSESSISLNEFVIILIQ